MRRLNANAAWLSVSIHPTIARGFLSAQNSRKIDFALETIDNPLGYLTPL
jgi:hypothetical protein